MFSLKSSNNLLSFRRKNYPTLHTYHVKNNQISYKFSLKFLNKYFNLISKSHNLILKNFFHSKNNFLNFILFAFFLKNNLLKFFNFNFFKNINTKNLIKIVSLFFFSSNKLKQEIIFHNLNIHTDWFNYNFSRKYVLFEKSLKNTLKKTDTSVNLIFFKNKFNIFSKFFKLNTSNFLHFWSFFFDKTNMSLVFLNNSFKSLNKEYYPIRFNETSSNKFIELNKISDYCFFFIRKNRIFNKGRYSRNRQTYRTGVYWCLWFNILSVYGLYFIFYRFTFNFGYLWLPLIIFFGSFIFSRALKYNFFNLNFVILELKNFFKWSSLLYANFYHFLLNWFDIFFKKVSTLYIFSFLKNLENIVMNYFFSNSFANYFFSIKKSENEFENIWNSLNNPLNKFFLKL